jgi:hypothetical protein
MTRSLKEMLITGVSICLLGAILTFSVNIEHRLNKIESDLSYIKGQMSKQVSMTNHAP